MLHVLTGSCGRSIQATIDDRRGRRREFIRQGTGDCTIIRSVGGVHANVASRSTPHKVIDGRHITYTNTPCTHTPIRIRTLNTPHPHALAHSFTRSHAPVIPSRTFSHSLPHTLSPSLSHILSYNSTPANSVIAVDLESGLLAINCTSASGDDPTLILVLFLPNQRL